jgi:hypothetical protein
VSVVDRLLEAHATADAQSITDAARKGFSNILLLFAQYGGPARRHSSPRSLARARVLIRSTQARASMCATNTATRRS